VRLNSRRRVLLPLGAGVAAVVLAAGLMSLAFLGKSATGTPAAPSGSSTSCAVDKPQQTLITTGHGDRSVSAPTGTDLLQTELINAFPCTYTSLVVTATTDDVSSAVKVYLTKNDPATTSAVLAAAKSAGPYTVTFGQSKFSLSQAQPLMKKMTTLLASEKRGSGTSIDSLGVVDVTIYNTRPSEKARYQIASSAALNITIQPPVKLSGSSARVTIEVDPVCVNQQVTALGGTWGSKDSPASWQSFGGAPRSVSYPLSGIFRLTSSTEAVFTADTGGQAIFYLWPDGSFSNLECALR